MAIIKPFKGWRPKAEVAAQVASRPYDVLNSDEAREEAKDNPWSFLHVVKPEIDLPLDLNPYDQAVYKKGKENFEILCDSGVFIRDNKDSYYIYELTMDGRAQTGIVARAAVDDYLNDNIKKHELTRPDKEEDRKNHVRVSMINAEPVFFAYRAHALLDSLIENEKSSSEKLYEFTAEDGILHKLWVVNNPETVIQIEAYFREIPETYVADGHHRTAAAALVGAELRAQNPGYTGDEPFNYFLAVHFPDDQLQIFDYNRVIKDLNGLSHEAFLNGLEKAFEVEIKGERPWKPDALHSFGMYLNGLWYSLKARPGKWSENAIGVLDVSILTQQVLEPLLNITNQRTDKRIDFVGGIRGLGELKRRVDSGEMAVAFALYPVSMQQLFDIADSGEIMPPKTTWFEPKLRSGLVVHSLLE
ncbi:MAG: DUF1015 domain-containing protein [Cyclobacteriaceae bacterium]|nr:DUF1015 domain-containing protein [Cyclobacteriaceae bacterium]